MKKEHRLGELPDGRTAYRDAMRIALPSIIEMVLMSLIGSVDTMMVGGLGKEALSAVGLPTQPRMLLLCMFFALNVGITAIVARRRGEERQDAANATLRNALMLALGLSVVLAGIAIALAEPLMRLAGGEQADKNPEILRDAVDYFKIMTYALPVNALSMCICAAQRGTGKTKITMWVNMASNLVNVFFNYCLIEGHLGFPRLEVRGAAIASVIGMGVGFLMALWTVVAGGRFKGYLHLSLYDKWRFDKTSMESIIRVGGNAAIEQLGVRFGFFIYARILFSLGPIMYAANQICMQLLSITFTFGDGLGVAATALVGQNLGRKRADLSMMYGKICQRYAMMISVVLGVLILSTRWQLAALFINESTENAEDVIRYAASTMLVLAAVQPFQTSSVVLSGSLRGAGDNLYVALIATICVSVIRPAMTIIAVRVLGLELTGTWIFGLAEIVVRVAFFYPRFAGGKWKNKKV